MLLETFPAGPLQCNCSIIYCPDTKEAAIIDPGGDADKIIALCKKHDLQVKYLLHTHAHFDHVLGSAKVKEATGASILVHQGDQWLYDNLAMQCGMFGFKLDETKPIDKYLEDDQEFTIGNIKTSVLHTPGHTPGSCCFTLATKDNIVFSGDTLFSGSIGRTDLWGGNYDQIIKSIKDRLLPLDDGTTVIPGHGPNTNIWSEKRSNPFLN